MIVVGIDPGLTGAVAAIAPGLDMVRIEDLPTVPLPGEGLIRRKIDALGLVALLRAMVPADSVALIVMEDVHTIGGQAVQTMGSMMRTLGAIEGVVAAMRLVPRMIQPKAWKAFYGIGSLKASSILVAQRLYPDAPIKLAKHHNRAEALLLAHYGVRKLA